MWLASAIISCIMSGLYPIFGTKANAVHGQNVTLLVESALFLLIPISYILYRTTLAEYEKTTALSLTWAVAFGICSIGYVYLTLYAYTIAPQKMAAIVLITDVCPLVVTVCVTEAISRFRPEWLPGATRLTPTQWIACAIVLLGTTMFNLGAPSE